MIKSHWREHAKTIAAVTIVGLFDPSGAGMATAGHIAIDYAFKHHEKEAKNLSRTVENKLDALSQQTLDFSSIEEHEVISSIADITDAVKKILEEDSKALFNAGVDPSSFKTKLQVACAKARISHAQNALPFFDKAIDVVATAISEFSRESKGFTNEGIATLIQLSSNQGATLVDTRNKLHEFQKRELKPLNEQKTKVFFGPTAQRTKDFVERESTKILRDAIFSKDATGIWILKGMPGSGKTQIASDLITQAKACNWPVVVWCTADDRNKILSMYRSIAGLLAPGLVTDNPEETAQIVLSSLHSNPQFKNCLFVFDNVMSGDDLRGLVPEAPGFRSIITTNSASFEGSETINIPPYAPSEAEKFLSAKFPSETQEDRETLAKTLGYLPLALAQAAYTMHRLKTNIKEYIEFLENYRLDEVVERNDGGRYPYEVDKTLLLSVKTALDSLVARQKAPALNILSVLCFLATTGIPKEWVTQNSSNGLWAEKALSSLEDSSLIQFSGEKNEILIHGLIGRVIRENPEKIWESTNTSPISYASQTLISLVTRLADSSNESSSFESTRKRYEQVLMQLLAISRQNYSKEIANNGTLVSILPAFLSRAFTFRLSNAISSLDDYVSNLCVSNKEILHIHNTFGMSYLEIGRLDKAIPLFEENYQTLCKVLGETHPNTLTTQNNLASAYQDAGQLNKAIPLFEENYQTQCEVLGETHPNTLTTQNNLASAYQDAGQLNKAIPLFEENYQTRCEVLGETHPDTLASRNNLARAYQDAGQLNKAIELYEENYQTQCEVLGETHPDTLTSRNNLASAYLNAGQLNKAIELFEENYQTRCEVLGETHPKTLLSRNNLALAYKDAGRLEEAKQLLEGD